MGCMGVEKGCVERKTLKELKLVGSRGGSKWLEGCSRDARGMVEVARTRDPAPARLRGRSFNAAVHPRARGCDQPATARREAGLLNAAVRPRARPCARRLSSCGVRVLSFFLSFNEGININPNYVYSLFFIFKHILEREKAIERVLGVLFVIFLEYSSIPSADSWFFSQFLGFHVKFLVCSFLLSYLIFYYCLLLFLD